MTKAHAGAFARFDAPPRRHLKELRGVTGEVGDTIGADAFEVGDKVHVSATSARARGFQGTVKRHGFGRGPVSHGSHNIRQPGSVGASADPARVFKGQKMPGQMGNKAVTVRNLEVVAVDRGEQRALGPRRRARWQEHRRQASGRRVSRMAEAKATAQVFDARSGEEVFDGSERAAVRDGAEGAHHPPGCRCRARLAGGATRLRPRGRSEVRGSGAKLYRQKGTGRARAGDV